MLPSSISWCSRITKMEKIFWIVISLAALGALIYEWVLIVNAYMDEPLRSNVFYKEPKKMRFPSLLFCQRQFYLNETMIGGNLDLQPSQNVAKYMRIVSNPTGADAANVGSNSAIFGSEQDQTKAQSDYLTHVNRFQQNPWAAFEHVMLNCPDMIRQCSLGSQNYTSTTCCQQFAVKRLTPVGPCLAIQPPNQEIPASNGAFQIDFELPAAAYNFAPNFVGLDLYVGDMIGKPMGVALSLLDEDSYTVQLSATTYENNIDRECNRRLESIFPQFDFVGMDQAMRCTALAIKKLCQCDPVYKVELDAVAQQLYKNGRTNVGIDNGASYQVPSGSYQFCDLNNVLHCAAPLLNSTRDQANFTQTVQRLLGYVPCDMRPPCVDNRYHFAVTEFREMTPTSSSYRSRLRLYYEGFVLTEIDQRQSYNFHDVIVNMGGALTFWFIVVHILIYIVEAAKWCCNCGEAAHHMNGRNKVADLEAGPTTPPIVQPVHKVVAPVDTAEAVDEDKE